VAQKLQRNTNVWQCTLLWPIVTNKAALLTSHYYYHCYYCWLGATFSCSISNSDTFSKLFNCHEAVKLYHLCCAVGNVTAGRGCKPHVTFVSVLAFGIVFHLLA